MNLQMPYISIEAGSLELGIILFHLTHPMNEEETYSTYFIADAKLWCEKRNLYFDDDFLTSEMIEVKDGKVFLNENIRNEIRRLPVSGAWPHIQKIRDEYFLKRQSNSKLDRYI